MKTFHISDLLSITTGRLVSSRHMDGVYEILNFLTGDNLFTHQLPRACEECSPWLRTQFPQLFPDNPRMEAWLAGLDNKLATEGRGADVIAAWVQLVRVGAELPEVVPVYEMGADMHTHIDPLQELESMVGPDRVLSVKLDR